LKTSFVCRNPDLSDFHWDFEFKKRKSFETRLQSSYNDSFKAIVKYTSSKTRVIHTNKKTLSIPE